MLMLLPLLGMWILFMIMLWAKRGDGRRDLRRCPKCWYSMKGQPGLKCPECGYAARIEAELFEPRSRKGVLRAAWVAMVLMVAVWIWTWLPGPWTNKVPRVALRIALDMAAPYQGVPQTQAELDQSAPKTVWQNSPKAWERALWQQQVRHCMQQWADAVLETAGPIAAEELPRLVEFADLAHSSFSQTGGLPYGEGWIPDRVKRDVANVRANSSDPSVKMRAEWVLSELQYVGGDYSHRMDWGVVPAEVLAMCLTHSDPKVRLFGADRTGRRAHLSLVSQGAIAFPPVSELLKQVAGNDPDPAVRKRAKDVVTYMEAFKIK